MDIAKERYERDRVRDERDGHRDRKKRIVEAQSEKERGYIERQGNAKRKTENKEATFRERES